MGNNSRLDGNILRRYTDGLLCKSSITGAFVHMYKKGLGEGRRFWGRAGFGGHGWVLGCEGVLGYLGFWDTGGFWDAGGFWGRGRIKVLLKSIIGVRESGIWGSCGSPKSPGSAGRDGKSPQE